MPTYESGIRFARAHLLAHDMVAVTVMVDEVAPVDGRGQLGVRAGDRGRGPGEGRGDQNRKPFDGAYHDR